MEYGLSSSDLPKKKYIKKISKDCNILGDYRENFYGVWHIPLKANTKTNTIMVTSNDLTVFLIDGAVTLFQYTSPNNYKKVDITEKKSYKIKKNTIFEIKSKTKSNVIIFHKDIDRVEMVYLPFSLSSLKKNFKKISKLHNIQDYRKKYWGYIYSIFSESTCGKVMCIEAGSTGSLEYHLEKYETYYVYEGSCHIDLRYGRATNKTIKLVKGNIFHLSPGIMHRRRGSTENCVIIEISTKDNDSDSFIVESGV
tara:strand:+ start:1450 stop:2208 length:759 start_codon:yes stop_codon:yes gene_type:complete